MADAVSIFDIFKIGVGPSSSHTLGPWNAARQFRKQILNVGIDHLQIHLFGSLSKTGKGHGTDDALILGLLDLDAKTIDTSSISSLIAEVINTKSLMLGDRLLIFDPKKDIIFEPKTHDLHPNTMLFKGYNEGVCIQEQYILSVGGGFIETPSASHIGGPTCDIPYPVSLGAELLDYTSELGCNISDVTLKNELIWRTEEEVDHGIKELFTTMQECVHRGVCPSG